MRKPIYRHSFNFELMRKIERGLVKSKQTFDVIMSNYSTRFVLPECDILFLQNETSLKCFSAFAKIKRDVAKIQKPNIKETGLKYYQSKIMEMYADKIFCTDIKSAYANILYNDGYLSKDTFNYLQNIPKKDRLSSVGMLASHKTRFVYVNGELVTDIEHYSEFQEYFFYAVKRTYHIMSECKAVAGQDFLLNWVDCIYYCNEETREKVETCLTKNHLRFSSFPIYEFEAVDRGNDCLIKYLKHGKPVYFYVPKYKKQ